MATKPLRLNRFEYYLKIKFMSTHFTIELEQDGRWIAEILGISSVLVYGLTQQEAISKVPALALQVIADKLEHKEINFVLLKKQD